MGLCFDLGFLEQFLQGKIGEMRNEREYEVKAICYPFVSSFCESLCKSMVQKQLNRKEMEVETEKVERDVALMLKEAGFTLKFGDFEFSISNWLNRCDPMMTPIKCIETLSDRSLQLHRHHSPLMQQTKIGIHSGGGWPRPLTSPFHQTHALSSMMNINQVPNSAWGSRYRTSFHVPVKKETKAKGNVPKCLSTENLARVAMLLKKGVRGY